MKLKILAFSLLAIFVTSCTSSGGGNSTIRSIPGTWAGTSIAPKSEEKLEQIPKNLEPSTPTEILDEIAANLKSKKSRTPKSSINTTSFDVYASETLYIPLSENETSFVVGAHPEIASYSAKIDGSNLIFQSAYDGKYAIATTGEGNARQIIISNKMKYGFSENELLKVIDINETSGNFNYFKDSVRLFRLAFPESSNVKKVSLRLLAKAGDIKNTKIAKSEYNFLNKYYNFSSQDSDIVITSLSLAGVNDVELNKSLLNYSNNNNLNQKIGNYLLTKIYNTKDEINFLEKLFNDIPNQKYSNYIGNWYVKNGNAELGNKYLSGEKAGFTSSELTNLSPSTSSTLEDMKEKNYEVFKQYYANGEKYLQAGDYKKALTEFEKARSVNKNYNETSKLNFALGKIADNQGQYKTALDYYKTAVNQEKNSSNKPEIYYNMAIASRNIGNISDCKNYMTRIIQSYGNTTWASKAKTYLTQLK